MFTTRQLVYTISGFKDRKDEELARTKGSVKQYGAKQISKFWEEHVRGQNILKNPTAIDMCLTIKNRLFSLPEAESIVIWCDHRSGQKSVCNSPAKLQTIISRNEKPSKITWFMQYMKDALQSGRMTDEDFTLPALKGGTPKSISDTAQTQLAMKKFLLSEWLDTKPYPHYVKDRARMIFDSWDSWREHWHPFDDSPAVDTTWLLDWPKAYRDLLQFLEVCIFMPGGREEHAYRMGHRRSDTPKDLLSNYPFASMVKDLLELLNATADISNGMAGDGESDGDAEDGEKKDADAAAEVTTQKTTSDVRVALISSLTSSDALVSATKNLLKQELAYITEGSSRSDRL